MRTTNYGWWADVGNAENGNYIKLITASLTLERPYLGSQGG
jgi:hypothetical protein